MASKDLAKLLPPRFRDKTIDTLIRGLFNPHFTADDSTTLYGYVGSTIGTSSTDIFLTENSLERQLNQLTVALVASQGSETHITTWPELVQHMASEGIDTTRLGEWFNTGTLNFAPHIDLDMLSNYTQYVWVGSWLTQLPTANWWSLGIAADAQLEALSFANPKLTPDYYVIERGALAGNTLPVDTYPDLVGWSSWALGNLWVHHDDAVAFAAANTQLSVAELIQAKRPIIQYARNLKLSLHVTANVPSDTGTIVSQLKNAPNQPPLFDLYTFNGQHTGFISSTFFYQEDPTSSIDSELGRRLAHSENGYIFGHNFKHPTRDEPLFVKLWSGSAFELSSGWRGLSTTGLTNIAYDTTGAFVNQDKFYNFVNYYWPSSANWPAYNLLGEPEYTVIEAGGLSGWAMENHWVHVNTLSQQQKLTYVAATRPIIELNKLVETALLSPKVTLNQQPRFNLTTIDGQVPTDVDSSLSDAYAQGSILVRSSDLLAADIIAQDPNLRKTAFTYGGETYVSSLCMGHYTADSSYQLHVRGRAGAGNGSIIATTIDDDARPQVLKLIGLSATQFKVTSSVFGQLPNLTVGSAYSVQGTTLLVSSGTIDFDTSSELVVEVHSSTFSPSQLYVELGGIRKSATTVTELFTIPVYEQRRVTQSTGTGAWQTPTILFNNLNNELPSSFTEGDLFSHFTSIIGAQPDLVGQPTHANNYRALTPSMAVGGSIKCYNDRPALLLGLLSQRGASIIELLNFSAEAYATALNQIREYVEDTWLTDLHNGTIRGLSGPADILEPATYTRLKAYLETGSVFNTSTMPIKALTLTTPYLGLTPRVLPRLTFDPQTNQAILIHHDGHHVNAPTVDFAVYKRLVAKQLKRSDGALTPGIIGTANVPTVRPYAQQLWLDLANEKLYVFDVVSDIGQLPTDANVGQYSFNRLTGELWLYTHTWVSLGTADAEHAKPWRQLDLSATLQALILAFEQELYQGSPDIAPLDIASLEVQAGYTSSMQAEFDDFAALHGIIDPYQSIYNANDAFTWSYAGIGYPSTWTLIYEQVYGTARPDIQPWIPAGMTEAALLSSMMSLELLPLGPFTWQSSMWTLPGVPAYLRSLYVGRGIIARLAIDITTGRLLPPYAGGNAEQVCIAPPPTPAARYGFGDGGPVELLWRKTLAYRTALAKTYYRLNPLMFVTKLWGDALIRVGELDILRSIARPPHITDTYVHGDSVALTLSAGMVHVTLTSAPEFTRTYTIEIINVAPDVCRISQAGHIWTAPLIGLDLQGYAGVTINQPAGLNVGDVITVTLAEHGGIDVQVQPTTLYKLGGLGQLYGLYHLYNTVDLDLATDRVLLAGWSQKLAYRYNRFIDTDALQVGTSPTSQLLPTTYNVHIKETLSSMVRITGLQVTLLRRGSTVRRGTIDIPAGNNPGGDWLYRVDMLSPTQRSLTWLSPGSQLGTFIAHNGQYTTHSWAIFEPGTPQVITGPFAVSGIQNLITFVHGYAAWLHTQGFVFDEIAAEGWQEQLETFIDQQFAGGVGEGDSFELNPISRKFKFNTPNFVTAFNQVGTSRLIPAIFSTSARLHESYRVFRDGDETMVISDVPMGGAMVGTSNFEHVIILENLLKTTTGYHTPRIFFRGLKQANPTGKPSYDGKYLFNGQMRTNLEASVKGVNTLYDLSAPRHAKVFEHTSALLAFKEASWMSQQTDQTQLQFWRGMLSAKGTNKAYGAFINASVHQSTQLDDEVWAYKVAEYGDARRAFRAELNIYRDELRGDRVNYLLLEGDELELTTGNIEDKIGGLDMNPYDTIPYDQFGHIVSTSGYATVERVDPRTAVLVPPNDERHWGSYADLGALSYVTAAIIGVIDLIPTSADVAYELTLNGQRLYADMVEIAELDSASENVYSTPITNPIIFQRLGSRIYREQGDYAAGTYTDPKFIRLNAAFIKFTDNTLLNRRLKLICYGPPLLKYTPSAIYHKNVPVTTDILWWDPVRGINAPAGNQVDIRGATDPATYNVSTYQATTGFDVNRVWGNADVGKIWWNTANLGYMPYMDSRIVPDAEDRLAMWGSLAQWSSMEIYGWVRSQNPPTSYTGDGEVALKRYITRTRTWQARPTVMLPKTGALHHDVTNMQLLNGQLVAVDGILPSFQLGEQVATLPYTSVSRDILGIPNGLLEVTALNAVKIGASGSMTAPVWVTSSSLIEFNLDVSGGLINGKLTFAHEAETVGTQVTHYVRATAGSLSQRVIVEAPPALAGPVELNFAELGVKLSALTTSTAAGWPTATPELDIATAFSGHDIFVRQACDVDVIINPTSQFTINGVNGWIGWMPLEQQYTYDELTTEGSPVDILLGNWVSVSGQETRIKHELQLGIPKPYATYREVWSSWELMKPYVQERTVLNADLVTFQKSLRFERAQIRRMMLYINGRLYDGPLNVGIDGQDTYVLFDTGSLAVGSIVRCVIPFVMPLQSELSRTLTDNPQLVTESREYMLDMPYTSQVIRNANGRITETSYYFWVRQQTGILPGKQLSLMTIVDELQNPISYIVPQLIKPYNQLDGRPNRYAMICLRGLNNRLPDGAKLRLIEDGSMRHDDVNISLRPVHTEWKLLRRNAATRLPKMLWDKVVDTVCGETATGVSLPFIALAGYDKRHGTSTGIGLQQGQVLAPKQQALATLRAVLHDTSVTVFSTSAGKFVPLPISFEGYDPTRIDILLGTVEGTRKLMTDIWNNAHPRNINELFFAILDDALTNTYELADIFKTSFIALDELRTL
jgi:hypothetical protein